MSHSHSVLNPEFIDGLIIGSLNGLDHYSYQFWIDHVLVCVKDPPNATESSKLIGLLDELSSLWVQGRPSLHEAPQYQSTGNPPSLSNHPAALELVRQVLAFRKQLGMFERDGISPEGKVSTMFFITRD